MLDKVELGIFFAAMIALVMCGCIFTRKPTRKPPNTAQPAQKETKRAG
jgi:hypothetical protein